MDLKAHLYEFGSLAQFLSPEKYEIFRRINFEYLLLLNKRATGEMQAILWEGIQANLLRSRSAFPSFSDSLSDDYPLIESPDRINLKPNRMNTLVATDIPLPVQDIQIHLSLPETVDKLEFPGAADSYQMTRQTVRDIREALNGDKDHSKWLLIATYKEIQNATRLYPANFQAQFLFAWLCNFFFRKSEKAEKHFSLAVQHAFGQNTPFAVFALRHLAEVRRELDKLDLSVEAANEAYMLDQQQTPQIIFDLSRYLILSGQDGKAKKYLESLLENQPSYFWQIIADTDFAKSREIKVLINDFVETLSGPEASASDTSEEDELAGLLEENERIYLESDHSLHLDDDYLSVHLDGITTIPPVVFDSGTMGPIIVRQPPRQDETVSETKPPPPPLSDERDDAHSEIPADTHAEPEAEEIPTAGTGDKGGVIEELEIPGTAAPEASQALSDSGSNASGPYLASMQDSQKPESAANDAEALLSPEDEPDNESTLPVDSNETPALSAEENIPEDNVEDLPLIDKKQLEYLLIEVENTIEKESAASRLPGNVVENRDKTHLPDAPKTEAASGANEPPISVNVSETDRSEILDLLQQIGKNLNLGSRHISAPSASGPASEKAEPSATALSERLLKVEQNASVSRLPTHPPKKKRPK